MFRGRLSGKMAARIITYFLIVLEIVEYKSLGIFIFIDNAFVGRRNFPESEVISP